MAISNLFIMLGGLAVFLFGMNVMGNALERQADSRLRNILTHLTENPLLGFLWGLSTTAALQSSSAATVMVVGFVNSGLMQLHQAVGIIIGCNVGSTATSWLLTLAGLDGGSWPGIIAPLAAFIGILLYQFCRREYERSAGLVLLGFSVLLLGLGLISSAAAPLAANRSFSAMFSMLSNPILGVIAGAVLTAVLQSSSASIGILQALSVTGTITYTSAIPIIMGLNIGTCITALISSVGTNKNARRTAAIHLYFNLIGSGPHDIQPVRGGASAAVPPDAGTACRAHHPGRQGTGAVPAPGRAAFRHAGPGGGARPGTDNGNGKPRKEHHAPGDVACPPLGQRYGPADIRKRGSDRQL